MYIIFVKKYLIMDYIKNNIEWLFSGVGIYIIGFLVTLILIVFGIKSIKFFVKFEGTVTNKKETPNQH
jgi:hypothetical protein